MTHGAAIDPAKARGIARIINWYLTPFALLIVALSAAASGLHRATELAIGIAVITGIMNPVFIKLMQRYPAKTALIRNTRIAFNYFCNIGIVALLWPFWKPVWILLLLSISAIGIFEDRQTTAVTAAMFTLVLAVIHFLRGVPTLPAAMETLVYCASLWTAGLLINHLVHAEFRR